jgi:hypothetical protein
MIYRNILPEYFIEKKIIYITDFYSKMKKKKFRKGSLFKEYDEDTYYFTKDLIDIDDIDKTYIIQYLTDGINKTILTHGFFNVEIDQTVRIGYVLDNDNNSLKHYSDNNSLIVYFSNCNSNSNNLVKKKCRV